MLFISCFASLLFITSRIKARDQVFDLDLSNSSEGEESHDNHDDVSTTFLDLLSTSRNCEIESRNLIFVSTVDGQLSCLNGVTGNLMWTRESKWPLVSSSISSVKNVQDFADVRFIPSLDGNLYKWNGENLENIPVTIDQLLGTMKRLPDGSLITGGKEIIIYGLDIQSGKLCYECSTTGCQAINKNDNIKEKNIMLLRRIQNTVRVVQPSSGNEKWNFSVGTFEIDFVSKENEALFGNTKCESHHTLNPESLHFMVQQGVLTNVDSEAPWKFQFTSPITSVWRLENDSMKPVDIFRQGLLDELPDFSMEDKDAVMYLGIHEGQMYIQTPPKRNYYGNAFSNEIEVFDHPRLTQWRPLISTPSRTPSLNNEISKLTSLDYPYDNGFVLVSNFSATALSIPHHKKEEVENAFCHVSGENNEKCLVNQNSQETVVDEALVVPLSIRDWWKEIFALSIGLAIIINVGYRVVKRKLSKTEDKLVSSLPPVSSSIEIGTEEVESSVEFVKRNNSISIPTDTIDINLNGGSTTSADYNSRYLVDFDHVQCLGQGGFGVVFKAKKKIDDCEYAIKRIYLPQCEEAKEKMMREVKALAALDHPGIVRYFHAWWETPPKDWQIITDKEQLLMGLPNSSPSYALSKDWMLEVHSIFGDDAEDTENSAPNNNRLKRSCVRKKTKSNDDPLGKRFNFDTGIEQLISDHKEFDLLHHNDVFYSDEDDSCISFTEQSHPNDASDDSFIVFENSIRSNVCEDDLKTCEDSEISESNGIHKRTKTLTVEESSSVSSGADKNSNQSRKKRFVGRCCTRTSSCLTEPPLFLYIQMQLCKQATLKEWLRERTEAISLLKSLDIFLQIVKAVKYFHGRGMMHRDLKPANIFFSLDGHVKVGDFGLVTAITRPSQGKPKGQVFVDENHTGQVGTQLYMSPEQAQGRPYSQKVDIYSMGLILFELLCYFATDMERMQMLYRVKNGTLPDHLLGSLQGELVKNLTAENPDDRPEAEEIIERLSRMTVDETKLQCQ